jgi:hypothetical protein
VNRSYRTPKGTDLPLLSLKGKEYLEVKYRLVWFREEHPDWAIETNLVSATKSEACAKATIKDEQGRVVATSHKCETLEGFPDFVEKSETGAIGRALALCGYGTQFCADELDEGARIVDSPVSRPMTVVEQIRESDTAPVKQTSSRDPGDYKITFGTKFKGVRIRDLRPEELKNYIDWLDGNSAKSGKPLSGDARSLKENAEKYLAVKS